MLAVTLASGVSGVNGFGGRVLAAQTVTPEPQITHATPLPRGEALSRMVTVQLDKVPLKTAVRSLAERSRVRILYEDAALDAVTSPVTLRVANAPLYHVLDQILSGTGLRAVSLTADVVLITAPALADAPQTPTIIVGRVIDARTRQPVAGATVVLGNSAQTVTTDTDGAFRISADTGVHTVRVRAIGFAAQARQVSVTAESAVVTDFVLERSTSVLDEVVVTGTVVATERKAIPNAITVISARQIEERGITRIEQLFRGDVPGLFAVNMGSLSNMYDSATVFSRGSTTFDPNFGSVTGTPMKTYVDGVELVNPAFIGQIDTRSIERIEILTGPQASTIYGSNAINGVIQIFTKRGFGMRPQISASVISGLVQNNYSSATTPVHTMDARILGSDGRWSYNAGGVWDYIGAWTPAKQYQQFGMDGGLRVEVGPIVADATARRARTLNRVNGEGTQGYYDEMARGNYQRSSTSATERVPPSRHTSDGQTLGFTVRYAPRPWWSHELTIGHDQSNTHSIDVEPGFALDLPPQDFGSFVIPGSADTALRLRDGQNARFSQRYTTTARVPVPVFGMLNMSLGGDRWNTRGVVTEAQGYDFSSWLPEVRVTRARSKNSGLFLQSQLDIRDALFLTYGVRAEWSPYYGDDAQPQIVPRYGIAYARDFGVISAKLRGSYGRATRPPAQGLRDGWGDPSLLPIYGTEEMGLSNPDLGPEYQQGGEAGLEVYFGGRGSLVITRYNQTVDQLIAYIGNVDSVRSLQPDAVVPCFRMTDAEGYCWLRQSIQANVGAIRNQGWELQGSVNLGAFSARGMYTWAKSRMIGITPRYRELLQGTEYYPGHSFTGAAEHVWGTTLSYAYAATSVSLTVNGVGQLYTRFDRNMQLMSSPYRFEQYMRARFGYPNRYRSAGKGYTVSDLNASHRFTSNIEGVLHILNLTDFYQNDMNVHGAVLGRQTRAGLRINWR